MGGEAAVDGQGDADDEAGARAAEPWDGVASVRVIDGSGSPRERPVRVRITDNVFHVLLPLRMGPHMTVEWRDAAGTVIRRTHPRY